MPLRLPPLSSLRFFEAAGRHCSFKLAAAELSVTPSAVSHGIVGLEQALGVELFVREPGRLALTPAGADYLVYVSEAFSLIAIGTQRLPDKRARRPIAVSCAPTLASRWLLPRLAGFRECWPAIDVTVDTSRRQVGFPVDGFDFAIRLSRAPVAGEGWARLFGERHVPVCSAAYRERLLDEQGRPDLRRATLIHVDTASEDWQAWLDATGIAGVPTTGGLRFDTIQLAFEAAAAGLGVVLGRRPLVDREIESGALVEAGAPSIDSHGAYWLVSSEGVDQRPDLASFRNWLLEEAEQPAREHAGS
ncbi:LysR family transcriptional regulator [Caballeronia arationis]|jgi:DNA-binding transcriptional LysR family regulator|uniref:DNA-binding transcriptional regulator, LysR family n=1 Tax=Caballeronia arationis TaxID=1777142 RepID=A0A7Z7N5W0_9BURK|nr:LysR substrate-binding domain-containing protein [Caballeronia arationis]SAK68597.1 LysR family transcriptional regulator [Caballeronia arationis]SOE88091.1 DNA-binding transcriptional regulator, LysR family [Caballeronia arationis]